MSKDFPIPVAVLRKEFIQVRGRSHASTHQEFKLACQEYLIAHKLSETPDNWVRAAKGCHIPCRRCSRTGRFITGVANGQPIGPGGPCYRCSGKGYQTDEDARRNFGADQHQKAI